MKYAILVLGLLLVACEGRTVDREGSSFVDTTPVPTVDTGVPAEEPDEEPPAEEAPSEENITLPPGVEQNNTISLDEKKQYVGRDVVKLWVWNERGAQSLLMAEGTGASLPNLKLNIAVVVVGHEAGGEVKLSINGKPLRVLNEDEEECIEDACVHISDFFLNAAQE